jgi:hypothetical protein
VNRKLASTAIDEHRQRYLCRPAKIGELVERRAHRAARIEHVVDDHDVLAIQIPWQIGGADHGSRSDSLEIISVERDVERTLRNEDAFAGIDHSNQLVGKLYPTPLNSDEDQVVRSAIELNYLDRHSLQGALDGPGVEDCRCFRGHRFTNMARKRT